MANNKTSAASASPNNDGDNRPEPAEQTKKNDWGVSRIFWGLLFVIVGGMALFDNLGLVSVNWNDTWRLWPLIIIAAGASILSVRHVIWRIISISLVVLMLGAIIWVMVGDFPDYRVISTSKTTVQKSESVNKAEVNVKAGAISLSIGSADQAEVIKSTLESNIASVSKKSSVQGQTQIIDLTMTTNGSAHWWTGSIKSQWDINLSRNLPIKLSVDTGASDTDIDASDVKLTGANIKIGASSLQMKLGKKTENVDVSIDSGVSSILIKVPEGSGVRLKLESGLTSKQIADLKSVSENTYESAGYDKATNKIDIVAKVGVSSFTIERY